MHARTAGSVRSMWGRVPPRAWHLVKQGHRISGPTQSRLIDSGEGECGGGDGREGLGLGGGDDGDGGGVGDGEDGGGEGDGGGLGCGGLGEGGGADGEGGGGEGEGGGDGGGGEGGRGQKPQLPSHFFKKSSVLHFVLNSRNVTEPGS